VARKSSKGSLKKAKRLKRTQDLKTAVIGFVSRITLDPEDLSLIRKRRPKKVK